MSHHTSRAFSFIELLASLAIFSVILLTLFSALSSVQQSWVATQDRVEKYRSARVALDTLERRISGATLNTYWGYDDPESPTEYAPQSELHFISAPVPQLFEVRNSNICRPENRLWNCQSNATSRRANSKARSFTG